MIVLGSSLFVALVINPVLIAILMRVEEEKASRKRATKLFLIGILSSIPFYLSSITWLGNLINIFAFLTLLNAFALSPMTKWFQGKFLPKVENIYKRFLSWALNKKRPIWIIVGTFVTLILSFVLTGVFPPKVLFFPDNQPNYINIFVELPVGTNITKTNKNTLLVKAKIDSVLNSAVSENDSRTLMEVVDKETKDGVQIETSFIASVIEQVGKGTSDPMNGPAFGETPHKARITVSFCEFSHRKGINTSDVKKRIEQALAGKFNADVGIIVDKEQNGPPQKPAINIEITGSDEYGQLTEKAAIVQQYLASKNIAGVQKLKLDVEVNKAEINLDINREYAKRVGLSTGQIGQNIRTSLFGKDVSTYSYDEDDYDVNIRFGDAYRSNLESILNQKVMFMNNRGQKLTIPISAVIRDLKIVNKHAAIKRKNLTNMVTIISGVKEGYNANEVIEKVKKELEGFKLSSVGSSFNNQGFNLKFTGQMEDQQKEMAFLSTALLIAVFLILLILVTQFNAFSTPIIILSSVVLSLSGVFLGIVISRSDFVIIMTMIGIISLAGIVVNNAIVLVDYTNLLRRRKRKDLEMNEKELLSHSDVKLAIVEGGKTRLRPVLLTAITTILGLFPLATGLNINFFTLVSEFDPQIFFGGDNVIFFKPMSLAIIYGLTFATFLTLVVVPVMYYTFYRFKVWLFLKMKWELKVEV